MFIHYARASCVIIMNLWSWTSVDNPPFVCVCVCGGGGEGAACKGQCFSPFHLYICRLESLKTMPPPLEYEDKEKIWVKKKKIWIHLVSQTEGALFTLLSWQVPHIYICDYHKNMIQRVRTKRKRKESMDGRGSPDADDDHPEVRCCIELHSWAPHIETDSFIIYWQWQPHIVQAG